TGKPVPLPLGQGHEKSQVSEGTPGFTTCTRKERADVTHSEDRPDGRCPQGSDGRHTCIESDWSESQPRIIPPYTHSDAGRLQLVRRKARAILSPRTNQTKRGPFSGAPSQFARKGSHSACGGRPCFLLIDGHGAARFHRVVLVAPVTQRGFIEQVVEE